MQALIVAGGEEGSDRLPSVLSLPPGAPAWTTLASLPRSLYGAKASIVGSRLRLTGGFGSDGSFRSEVMEIKKKTALCSAH